MIKEDKTKMLGIGIVILLLFMAVQPMIIGRKLGNGIVDFPTENGTDVGSGDPCDEDKTKPDVDENNNETDNETGVNPDSEVDPYIQNEMGGGLHIEIATGNVITELKICSQFTIRYNSLNSEIITSLGYGWTHGNNIYLDDSLPDGVVIVDGHGLFSKYTGDIWTGFTRPPGRWSDLYWQDDHYVLEYSDGCEIEFSDVRFPDNYFYICKYKNTYGLENHFTYNDDYLLERIDTGNNKSIKLDYYGNNKLKWVEHANGEKTKFYYNIENELINVLDPFDYETWYDYDQYHRITFEQLKNDVSYSCIYIEDVGVSKERYLIDSEDSIMFHLFSEDGFPDHRPVTCIPGVVKLTDGNGKVWNITRNTYGQHTLIESPDGFVHEYEYYELGEIGECMLRLETNPRGFTKSYTYDEFNNLISVTNEKGEVIEYQYNDPRPRFRGLMTDRIRGDSIWHYAYNDQGRLIEETDPYGNTTTYDYTYWGGSLPNRIKRITKTDRNGHITVLDYDVYGRLENQTVYSVGGFHALKKTKYQYFNTSNGEIIRKITIRGTEHTDEELLAYIVEYGYDNMGLLMNRTIDPSGLNLVDSFTYDAMGNIDTYTNPKGTVIKYNYDHRGRPNQIIEDYGGFDVTTSIEYDGNNNIVNITDPNGNKTQLIYDNQNQMIRVIDAENYNTVLEYDQNGNILNIVRGRYPYSDIGLKASFNYDELDRITKIILDPDPPNGLALDTQIGYVSGLGGCGCDGSDNNLIHNITDARGKVTYYHYDKLERITDVVKKVGDTLDEIDEDDVVYKFFYDAEGNIVRIIGPEGKMVEFEYDVADRLVRTITDPYHFHMEWNYEYDGADNLVKMTLPNGNVIITSYDEANRPKRVFDSVGSLYSIEYDANGNIVNSTDGIGRTSNFQYDALDRIEAFIDPEMNEASYAYDDNSNLIKITDQNGIVTKYLRNNLSWITGIIRDYMGDGETANTQASIIYNGLGLVEALIDNNGYATRYFYNSAAQLIKVAYPDDPNGLGDDHITFGYDETDNMVSRTDQSGDTMEYVYDDLNRLIEVIHPAKGEQQAYSDVFTYDRSGRLIKAMNPYAKWFYGYDSLGRLSFHDQSIAGLSGNGNYNTTFEYIIDERSELRIGYPGLENREVIYGFDLRSRLVDAVSGNIQTILQYNDANELTEMVLGESAIESSFTYDNNGRPSEIMHYHDDNLIYGDNYGYDEVGNRIYTKKLHDVENSEVYAYDNLSRLINFRRGELTFNGNQPIINDWDLTDSMFLKQWQTWDLDSNGNWMHIEQQLNYIFSEEDRAVNEVNEYTIVDGEEMVYDNNGNLLDDGENAYVYDDMNRLVKIINQTTQQETSFTYGPLGNRVISNCDDETMYYLHSGVNVIQEREADGSLHRDFIPGVFGLLAMVDYTDLGAQPAGIAESFYYLKDMLGSTVALTDTNGDIIERYYYEPYGDTVITDEEGFEQRASSAYGNPFMWTGQRYDSNHELYHFWARSYSPMLGRWLQRDPLGYIGGLNLYQYVYSRPMNLVDPLGLYPPDALVDQAILRGQLKYGHGTKKERIDRGTELIKARSYGQGIGAGVIIGTIGGAYAVGTAPIWGPAVGRFFFFFRKGGLLNNPYIRLGPGRVLLGKIMHPVIRLVIGSNPNYAAKYGIARIFGWRVPFFHLYDFWPLGTIIKTTAGKRFLSHLIISLFVLFAKGDEKDQAGSDLFKQIPAWWHAQKLWPLKVFTFLYSGTIKLFKWLKDKLINQDSNNAPGPPENPNPCPKDTA